MDLGGLPYSIEPMRLADVPTVSAIERQVFTTPWSPQAFRQEILYHHLATYLVLRYTENLAEGGISDSLRRLLGTRQDPALLGYGGCWMVLDQGHISTLSLRSEWRGRGLGELILAALIEKAMEQEAETLTLEVRVSNQKAQKLYAKYEFEIAGRRKRYYPDNHEDAWIMTTPSIQTSNYQKTYRRLVSALLHRLHNEPQNPPGQEATDQD